MTNQYLSTPLVTPGDTILTDTLFMLDSVLSATATTFSDAWAMEATDLRFDHGSPAYQLGRVQGMHPFASGERGVWRPKDSYVYVDDRKQSAEVNTRRDGTFDGLPMFDFQKLTFDACAENWRQVREVTRYSPFGYEIEEQDALEVYSAALYGYLGKLPIAVAANADYREIGYESFEEYEAGASLDVLELGTGNIDLYTDNGASSPLVYKFARVDYGQADKAWTTPLLPADTFDTKVQGRSDGELFSPAYNVAERQDSAIANGTHVDFVLPPYLHLQGGDYWKGYLAYEQPVLSLSPTLGGGDGYSATKAHTGQRSFKWTGRHEFPQNRLKLQPGKVYALQLWVSRDNADVPTFVEAAAASSNNRLNIQVRFYNAAGTLISSSNAFEPSGHLVEGWQKIEGEFEVPAGTANISFRLQSGKVSEVTTAAYLDDIRIQPLASKMTCYVYDTQDYRLRATLDDDNFATRYHYDEAGGLYLVQKETIEGLRTIQESRTFIHE